MPRGGSHFGDRLAALVEERRSRVVLGLDPDPAALWPAAVAAAEGAGDRAVLTAGARARHRMLSIDAARPARGAGKPQLARLHRLRGAGGRGPPPPPAPRPP